MPPAIAVVAGIGSAVASVAGVVAGIAATVTAVIAPVVAAIGSVVSVVVSALAPAITGIIEVIGGIVEAVSVGVQGAVGVIKTTIAEPLGNIITGLKTAIGEVVTAITEPLAPILNPIKDSLVSIKDFVVETQTWIQTELAPVGELIEVINTVSAVMFVKQLIEGTASITQIIGDVESESGAATAQAIALLFQDIVDTSIGTVSFVREQSVALANTVDSYDKKIREDNRIALAMLSDSVDEHITQVADGLTGRVEGIDTEITMIARRTEDLPYFQDMLIKALS